MPPPIILAPSPTSRIEWIKPAESGGYDAMKTRSGPPAGCAAAGAAAKMLASKNTPAHHAFDPFIKSCQFDASRQ
jgi:hypothetical protein